MGNLYRFTGLLLMVCILVSSCRPRGVLSRDDMEDVLFDVHLAEALTDPIYNPTPVEWRKGLDQDQFRDLSYQSVFLRHNITEDQFFKSVGYYSKKIQLYSRIYSTVEKRLRDYYQSVEDWEYHELSGDVLEQTVHRDSLKMRQMFELLHVMPDTVSQLKNSYCPDSVESFLRWNLNRWLREAPLSPIPFRVIDQTLSITLDSLTTDSLRIDSLRMVSLKADSLAKDSVKRLSKNNIILNKKGEVVAIKGRRLAPINPSDSRHLPGDRKKPVRFKE